MHVAPKRTRRERGEGKGERRGRAHGRKKVKIKLKPGKGNHEGCPMYRQKHVEHIPAGSFKKIEVNIMERDIDPTKFTKLAGKVQMLRQKAFV